MKTETGINYIADGVALVMSVVQSDAVLQYISFGLTIVATLVSIAFTLIQLLNWWKKAKEDGKITKEELEEAKKIIEDGKKHLDKNKGKGER